MLNKKTGEEQINQIKHLINFDKKINENNSNLNSIIVEFSKKAANGKTYGIIRECNRFYIKEAPEKNTEVLAEDFDYIGGFNNKKENEFTSYTKAYNKLNLKLMSINETVENEKKVITEQPKQESEWTDELTESMRNDIERFKTIFNNASKILNESSGFGEIPSQHTDPEKPSVKNTEETNTPYTVNPSKVKESKPKLNLGNYTKPKKVSRMQNYEDSISEDVLHDFGKHPRYGKEPMTTGGTKDKTSNLSYGRKIGKGKPYDKLVDTLTEEIMSLLKKKV